MQVLINLNEILNQKHIKYVKVFFQRDSVQLHEAKTSLGHSISTSLGYISLPNTHYIHQILFI